MRKYDYTIHYDEGTVQHLDGLNEKLDLTRMAKLDVCLAVFNDKPVSFLINMKHVVYIEETYKEEE